MSIKKICGVELGDFRVLDNTLDGACDNVVEKLASLGVKLEKAESAEKDRKHTLVICGEKLTYKDYEIKFGAEKTVVCGGYRSLPAAIEKFFSLIEGEGELTEADDVCGEIEAPEIPYKNRDELIKVITDIYNSDRMLFGEHLAGSMFPNNMLENYKKAVGKYPSMLDFDMLKLREHPKKQWSKTLCELVDFAAKGGVITTMHHWLNPALPEKGFRGNLGTVASWNEVLRDGTALNLSWRKELDRAGEFLKAMNDAGVTIMYRPLHEVNGNWFWFCLGQADGYWIPASDAVAMWKYVYNYYTNVFGAKNIVWEYGPNVANGWIKPAECYYPGPEYCDVVGYDWYTCGNYEIDGEWHTHNTLAALDQPVGIMEFGPNGELRTGDAATQPDVFSCEGYVEIFERMKSEGKKLAFAEVYAGIYGAPSVLGHGEALANYKGIIHLDEMPKVIKDILG